MYLFSDWNSAKMYFKWGRSRVSIFPLLSITAIVLVSNLLWSFSGYTFCHREPSLCGCQKCLRDSDPWFNDIISEAPEPFLSQKHIPSEEDFLWWKVNNKKNQHITFLTSVVMLKVLLLLKSSIFKYVMTFNNILLLLNDMVYLHPKSKHKYSSIV